MSNLKVVSYNLVLLKCIDTDLYETRGLSNLFFKTLRSSLKFSCVSKNLFIWTCSNF